MNILLLSNSAPNYHYFFNELATCFINDGSRVVVAVDSKFSREENGLDNFKFKAVHDFSSFFGTHETDQEILKRYSQFGLNEALLSDFERSEVYDIWGDGVDFDYFEKLKSALLSFFEEIFEEYKIDMVLYENVSNTFSHFAYFVALKRAVIYCGLTSSRLPGRFSVTQNPIGNQPIEATFRALRSGQLSIDPDTAQWVNDYLANIETIVPDYMRINGLDRTGLLKRYLRPDRLAKLKSLLRHAGNDRIGAFQIGNPLRTHTNLFLRNVRRRLRARAVRKIYQRPVKGEDFLLYPLHFHPESSTSVLAGTYLNEYEVIRNIAFNLPQGMRLYVKDHVSAWAYPSTKFYRRLSRLPNVRLLGPLEPTKSLIKESAAVITLTSTVGYEALLMNKQVFLYGDVFYDFHIGVARIENPAKLRSLIEHRLAKAPIWDEQYNRNFVCAYYWNTLSGSLNLLQRFEIAKSHAQDVYRQLKATPLLRSTSAM